MSVTVVEGPRLLCDVCRKPCERVHHIQLGSRDLVAKHGRQWFIEAFVCTPCSKLLNVQVHKAWEIVCQSPPV